MLDSLLGFDFFDASVDVEGCEFDLLHAGHEQGGVGEEVVHLLEGAFLGLWEHGPEEEGVCEVADLCLCE